MGEILLAALLVSILWVLWDVTKIYLEERQGIHETVAAREPGRDKLLSLSEAFDSLSETFLNLPDKQERLSEDDLEEIYRDVCLDVCQTCEGAEWCWKAHQDETLQRILELLGEAEEKGEAALLSEVKDGCLKEREFRMALLESFKRARLNLMWNNRLLENRRAVTRQLHETAKIIRDAEKSIYEIERVDGSIQKQIEIQMKLHGIKIWDMWKASGPEGKRELYVTMKTIKEKRCLAVREAAACLSAACGEKMMPARDSRMVINHEYSTILFVPCPMYVMLCGAAKVTKEGEVVSGDSFSMFHKESGQMILSISDGMGSGPEAREESGMVVDLLEQFLSAGFSKEAAVRMIHSVMLLKGNRCFSTIDVSLVNLYTGECEMMKMGASTTFLRRGDWVEAVSSTTMPMGILGEAEYECTRKQLREGDFLIMLSDGVLDAFPGGRAEEELSDVILKEETDNCREMAQGILERVLRYRRRRAEDDMTVLVGGLFRR